MYVLHWIGIVSNRFYFFVGIFKRDQDVSKLVAAHYPDHYRHFSNHYQERHCRHPGRDMFGLWSPSFTYDPRCIQCSIPVAITSRILDSFRSHLAAVI